MGSEEDGEETPECAFVLDSGQVATFRPLTIGAMEVLTPQLDSEASRPDEEVARAIFAELVRVPDEEGPGRRLTDEELKSITGADLERFARTFLEDEKAWEEPAEGVPPDAVHQLVAYVRTSNEVILEGNKKLMKKIRSQFAGLDNIVTPATKRLFEQSALRSENLRRSLGGIYHLKKMYSPAFPELESTVKAAEKSTPRVTGIDFAIARSQRAMPASVESAEDTSDINELSRNIIRNAPEAIAARTLRKIDDKADEAVGIIKEIAEIFSATNQAVLRGVNDFAEKRKEDFEGGRKALWTAFVALIVSMIALVVSAVFSYLTLGWTQQGVEDSTAASQALQQTLTNQDEASRQLMEDLIRVLEGASASDAQQAKSLQESLDTQNQQSRDSAQKTGKSLEALAQELRALRNALEKTVEKPLK